jgi:mannose-6-phosphate isomerase-like protein (cupin superfamily)
MEGAPVELLACRIETDERGSSFFFFPEPVDLDLSSLHLVATRPGQVRGNHAHPARTEYLFFFGGRGIFAWEEAGRVRQMAVGTDGQLVRIRPGTGHAYKNTGSAESYILACWGPRQAEGPDRVSAEVIPEEEGGHG